MLEKSPLPLAGGFFIVPIGEWDNKLTLQGEYLLPVLSKKFQKIDIL
jgi:hypothetical protein